MPYLHVTLFSAADLPASHSILVGGKSDPYAIIKVGNTKFRSLCLKNNLNPQWNPPEQFVFPIEDVASAVLSVKVFDMGFIKRDDLFGELVLPVAKFADTIDLWQHEKHHLTVPKAFGKQHCQASVELEICLKHVAEDRLNNSITCGRISPDTAPLAIGSPVTLAGGGSGRRTTT
ncbi:hypothetical protein V7S43_018314 [Phytophthora oleae]|uniref:C2 domain-containing protein n=1 Tax=Phytophthora oleae TaxID=2107226 RepID=A0ABD3EUQ7_9STRA